MAAFDSSAAAAPAYARLSPFRSEPHPHRSVRRVTRGPSMRIRTLIVDDEPWARKRLVSLFQAEPDCDVVGECADGESAVRAIVSTSPDLVCLDVRMPDMSGVDVLDAVVQIGKGPSDPCPSEWPLVMFVTAYDRYAVQAFERDAVDYLLKPFDDERFQQALARVRRDRVADGRAGAPLPQ